MTREHDGDPGNRGWTYMWVVKTEVTRGSGLFDTCVGPLELSSPLRTCMWMLSVLGKLLKSSASSARSCALLLVGKPGFLSLFFIVLESSSTDDHGSHAQP